MTPLPDQPVLSPTHIAIIMDGNGRWATQRGLPRLVGHKAGLDATIHLVRLCVERRIGVLTLFAFSSENWKRPLPEVNGLMQIFLKAFREKIKLLAELNVHLRVIGDLSRFDAAMVAQVQEAVASTRQNTGLTLVIAVSYGGQWDIVQAAQSIARQVETGQLKANEVDTDCFAQQLQLAGLPSPDLCIRAGGEYRISNFLLWYLAYSELYFTSTLWPDFDESALNEALAFYASRQRRFGNVKGETHV